MTHWQSYANLFLNYYDFFVSDINRQQPKVSLEQVEFEL
jgi:hypothetical protein